MPRKQSGGGTLNPNGYLGYSLTQLSQYPDPIGEEQMLDYMKRTGITDRNIMFAKFAEHRDALAPTAEQNAATAAANTPDDAFVSYMTAKAYYDTNVTQVALSVASMAMTYIDDVSQVVQPILDEIPGAGEAFSAVQNGLDALSKTWNIDPDQSNQGIANRIVMATEVARHLAIAIETAIKAKVTPEEYQSFINSFVNKKVVGSGIGRLVPLNR
jgi:hypothetical protein